jgi:hypothetical protein
MSMLPISHFTWQLLRAARRGKTPPTGKELRVHPSRKTKDGTFLDEVVAEGLIEAVSVDSPDEKTQRLPVQFRTRYKLTAKGEYAAEYGEYERELARKQPELGKDTWETTPAPRRSAHPR